MRVTYTGTLPGAVPGHPEFAPGETRQMSDEAAREFADSAVFVVAPDPAPAPEPEPASAPPPAKAAKSKE